MISVREQKIIDVLGRRRMTYESLSNEVFADTEAPFDSQISIGNSVRRIIKKCEAEKLKWTLVKKKINTRLVVWRISA